PRASFDTRRAETRQVWQRGIAKRDSNVEAPGDDLRPPALVRPENAPGRASKPLLPATQSASARGIAGRPRSQSMGSSWRGPAKPETCASDNMIVTIMKLRNYMWRTIVSPHPCRPGQRRRDMRIGSVSNSLPIGPENPHDGIQGDARRSTVELGSAQST